ncbi:hypothetical protein [Nocardioides mesophilus]|uniref:Uncharacterized protein n=1 Tax=Nocardioides mesophilus TaxID=433659 RepID=A0A7G9R9R6_9ACTN|nr:hypothetical protein [Nocardioides mesophilus]QNN52341.1 hypothetical protein H9L09_17930 [Nocardioides mesophilus]
MSGYFEASIRRARDAATGVQRSPAGSATASIRAAAARKPRSARMHRPCTVTTALTGPIATVALPGVYQPYSPQRQSAAGASWLPPVAQRARCSWPLHGPSSSCTSGYNPSERR